MSRSNRVGGRATGQPTVRGHWHHLAVRPGVGRQEPGCRPLPGAGRGGRAGAARGRRGEPCAGEGPGHPDRGVQACPCPPRPAGYWAVCFMATLGFPGFESRNRSRSITGRPWRARQRVPAPRTTVTATAPVRTAAARTARAMTGRMTALPRVAMAAGMGAPGRGPCRAPGRCPCRAPGRCPCRAPGRRNVLARSGRGPGLGDGWTRTAAPPPRPPPRTPRPGRRWPRLPRPRAGPGGTRCVGARAARRAAPPAARPSC